MGVNTEAYQSIKEELNAKQVTLVAVSKTKPIGDILELYELGQRDFGENYVQELVDKQAHLPKDIRWHFIGHLQSNKVKYIAPFVHLIHGVDSLKLLKEVNKEAAKNNRTIDVLLQVHIAQEETKFGLDENELNETIKEFENLKMMNVRICGLMGMASFNDDMEKVRGEFRFLKTLFDQCIEKFSIHHSPFIILSMGMSGDYTTAIDEGSTMVRIGSLLFGVRNYAK
ncbi:MAG: YggS family pyridoxal phosphate-dependent enzyme [Lacibacter sp.]